MMKRREDLEKKVQEKGEGRKRRDGKRSGVRVPFVYSR